MKKLLTLALLVLMASAAIGQTVRKHLILTTATRATPFGEYIKAGDFIFVTADGTMYQSKMAFSRNVTMAYLLLDTARYKVANTTVVGGVVDATTGTFSGAVDVAGTLTGVAGTFSGALAGTTLNTGQGANELYDMDQNVLTTSEPTFVTINTGQGANELYDMDQNVLTTSAVTFGTATLTTSVAVGAQAITTDHVNRAVLNNSLKVTDTAFIGSAQYIMQSTVNRLKTEGSLSVTDTVSIGSTQWLRQVSINRLAIEGSIATGTNDTVAAGFLSGTAGSITTLTAPKIKQTATDTTGVGSTANVGTMMYYNGHFYGLKAGEPPVWVALDN